ncbi:MAG: chromate transporter [Clostridiales bacterium]|jgi:chromate transporter|nr:chromate transporter [Clostridiales bacterium]
MLYLELFWSFFQVGLFSIGGGYAVLPMIQGLIVETNKWLTPSEYSDLLTLSQMTPGPIAINASTFVGQRMAGFGGACAATLGCVAPCCIIVLTLAFFYQKYKSLDSVKGVLNGLRPCVAALIASAGIIFIIQTFWSGEGLTAGAIASAALFAACLAVLRKFKPDPIFVILGAGIAGIAIRMAERLM